MLTEAWRRRPTAMLYTSACVRLLDRYRVPYVVTDNVERDLLTIAAETNGPRLFALSGTRGGAEHFYRLYGASLYVELGDEPAISAAMQATGRSWVEDEPILDASGEKRGSVYRAPDGSVFLPFELDAPAESLLGERYLASSGAGQLGQLARTVYYRMRPLLPRSLQLSLRRRYRRTQERSEFPAWPADTSLHRLDAQLLGFIEEVAQEPLPWISPWPSPYEWAVVLTHDVERNAGYQYIASVRAVEERHKLRSAWYLVPKRDYHVDESLLERLDRDGCEVCLHGLRHDGRDLAPGSFKHRVVAMRSYAERWGARGFRGPATLRDPALLQELGMEHDSTWSDVARYEPQPGGTCSWWPFFIGEVVELPITMPMDHTLFELLGHRTDTIWREKAELLRQNGGMALMLTHPDYLLDPSLLELYDGLLGDLGSDSTAWHALPREVANWWRDRSRTRLVRSDGQWAASGPGEALARVCLGAPVPPRATDYA